MNAETYANDTLPLNVSDPLALPSDPYRDLQPPFALSFPIQILMTSMTATLVAVLLIQMLFTAQYHWPLARLNFIFQLLGVCTLLISLVAELTVVLTQSYQRSREWPYMLSYIAARIPPADDEDSDLLNVPWTLGEKLSWYIMEAAVSGLVHIANIQYLTLLYPSKLERWLILAMLVPLAVVSAAMEIVVIHPSEKVQEKADLLRNICNCTLSLLFTIALCMWGFVINRRQAWRTDGGTAVFGAGAIMLAAASSALNIIVIPEKDRLFWLQPLVWSVVLWQSFLGWWWWVGCAVESNNIEDIIVRERKRAVRRSRTRSKKAAKAADKEKESTLKSGVHRMVGSLRMRQRPTANAPPATESASVPMPERLDSIESTTTAVDAMAMSRTASTSSAASTTTTAQYQSFWRRIWRALRREHESAAFVQALEFTDQEPRRGWGLGHFAVRERDEASRIVHELRVGGEARGLVDGSDPLAQDRSSVMWWGPLVRWRLRDRTVY